MLIFSMMMVFMHAYSWLLPLKLKSWMSFRSKIVTPDKSSTSKVKSKQILTLVYTSEQIEHYLNCVNFDPTIKTAVVDNAANAHIWCSKEDFVSGSLRPFPDVNACFTTIGGSDHKPVTIGEVKNAW